MEECALSYLEDSRMDTRPCQASSVRPSDSINSTIAFFLYFFCTDFVYCDFLRSAERGGNGVREGGVIVDVVCADFVYFFLSAKFV